MQNSVLVHESLMSGRKTQESLKGILPQKITFDH